MAKHGGKRAGAGRPRGSKTKATIDVREAAAQYTEQALQTLADIMLNGKAEQARAKAASELLDRAHGRPAQAVVGGSDDDPPLRMVIVTGVPDAS